MDHVMSSMQSVIFVFARVDLIEISSDTNHIIYGLRFAFWSESPNVNCSWNDFVSFATCRGCFDIYFKAFFEAKHTRIHTKKKHEKNGKLEKIIQNFNSMKLFWLFFISKRSHAPHHKFNKYIRGQINISQRKKRLKMNLNETKNRRKFKKPWNRAN